MKKHEGGSFGDILQPPRSRPGPTPALRLSKSLHLFGPRCPSYPWKGGWDGFREMLPISLIFFEFRMSPSHEGRWQWRGASPSGDSRMRRHTPGRPGSQSPDFWVALPPQGPQFRACPHLPSAARQNCWPLGYPSHSLWFYKPANTYRAQ